MDNLQTWICRTKDGIKWERKDDEVNIKLSDSGWDSEDIAYPYVIRIKNKYIMF